MKFGQLIKYSARRVASDLLLFFKKALYKVKASVQHLSFNILVNLDLDMQ